MRTSEPQNGNNSKHNRPNFCLKRTNNQINILQVRSSTIQQLSKLLWMRYYVLLWDRARVLLLLRVREARMLQCVYSRAAHANIICFYLRGCRGMHCWAQNDGEDVMIE
ncbi:Hypothetical_protein [Hexamita inflata]|uniref:Hypothetical_protein n=1 Tax=Hexamita inflata TaxID=28002 RepID=A0AA86PWQ2_9EUKA|nr:Hypothetical protein HINF_LOCUS30325 [Hexamita inflata]